MKKAITFVLIICMFLLAGCSDPPEMGVVLDKSHSSAKFVPYVPPKGRTVSERPPEIPEAVFVPEEWAVLVRDESGESGWCLVTEEEYISIKIGDNWPTGW